MHSLKAWLDRFGVVFVFAVIMGSSWLSGTMSGAQVVEGLVVIGIVAAAGDVLLRCTRKRSKQ